MGNNLRYDAAMAHISDLLSEGTRARAATRSAPHRDRRHTRVRERASSVLRRAAGRRAPVTPESASPRRVFALVATAAFLATLDLFIVNIAFPSIQARVPRLDTVGRIVGAERLCDRVRGAVGAGGQGG